MTGAWKGKLGVSAGAVWAFFRTLGEAEAKAALDAGALEQVDELLARVQAALGRGAGQRQLEAAATAAQRGQIALTRLCYREAAEHFAAATRRVPPGHEEQAWNYLDREAEALYRQGDEFR